VLYVITLTIPQNDAGSSGVIGEKSVIVDGQLEFREYLSMTISMDHDIIDGAPATRLALRLKELIESGYGFIDQDTVSRQSTFHN